MVQERTLTANSCLGEDRVDRKCGVIVMWGSFFHAVLSGSCSGNSCRGGMDHGIFTTSGLRTDSPDQVLVNPSWNGYPIWPSLRVLELFSRRCGSMVRSSLRCTVQSSSITSVAVHTPRRGNSCNTSTYSGWPCAFPMEVMNFRFVPRLVLLTCDLGQTIS